MTDVTLKGLRKSFGAVEVIYGVDLQVHSGEFVVFVGPSGCGKSTLLRMIAGLEDITAGELQIGGQRMNEVAPAHRGVSMVFQSYALYPHMDVAGNMSFAMRLARTAKETIVQKVGAAAETLQIQSYLDRLPKALSGGQRQRVAIGRAFVREPDVFLFDEPLSNLDAALRVQTRLEIAKLHQSLKATMIFVTHDQVEAMTLADRIVVLREGRVEQVGTPLELYHTPANLFVAGFIGSPKMNILPVTANQESDGLSISLAEPQGGGSLILPGRVGGGPMTLGLRPEHMAPDPDGPIAAIVDLIEQLGEYALVHAQCGDRLITLKLPDDGGLKTGDALRIGVDPARAHLFDADGAAVRPQQRKAA
ncbi:MAG: sn-glycerol-3-phosphate ABC transporter ATP-binding protein UgpC [Pseudomonadota bacterium]